MVINTNNDLTAKAGSHSNHKVNSAPAASNRQGEQKSAASHQATTQDDQVQLSFEAQTIKRLETKVQNSEGVDAAKVEDLRQRIASGEYTVNSQNLANTLLSFDN